MQTIITKGEFARAKGRHVSAVSRWISEGKISRAALIGEGVRARIWQEQADADLARALDPAQQAAQLHPIEIPIEAPPAAAVMPAPDNAASLLPRSEDDLARRRKADADKAEHDAEAARRKLAQDEGRWIDAAEARKEFGRLLARELADMETFLGNGLAHEIGDLNGLDWKQLSVQIRTAVRRYRMTAADRAADELRDREGGIAEAAE